ncbi:MAG: cysteine--tRNA ligase [Candidatus Curtissbacteria bacterium]
MKITNSQTHKKEEIDLKKPIGIYVCGITPYDTTHLGHAFTFIAYDVLVRYLRFLDAKVTYVQNVTDIDDDILIKSKSIGTTWQKLGQDETKKHLANMDVLNVLRPDYYPKATENITSMIRIIEVLIKKNLAYVKNGSVYFNIKSDKNFGKLSGLGYPAMLELANERGNFPLDPNKKDPLDFVLWQAKKLGEPAWDSPWGKGHPGWHIECSVMSMKYLGPTITIHGGGEDLIFPHHECEIAQSENYSGKRFVRIWMHAAMVYCGEKKMSKSLGNMIFVHDLLSKYSPNAIRIFLLSHHYRKSWNYQEQELKQAKLLAQILESKSRDGNLKNGDVKKLTPDFFNALDNDLNTPDALNILVSLAKSNDQNKGEVIKKCGRILGLRFN